MFAVKEKAKPKSENIGGLNLSVVKLITVQATKLPLEREVRKIGMICFAKPALTEDFYVAQMEEFSVT
jgi:hypothetical protein